MPNIKYFVEILSDQKDAYSISIHELAEELNCSVNEWVEEKYIKTQRRYCPILVFDIFGSDIMISYFTLRIEKYHHLLKNLINYNSLFTFYEE